ncbi:hypothetical protein NY99_20635 [Xanthomonas phaseoli pv. phaseoli]|nr:hypothetical protein NY99_20635 [Xanthomonas phaseoli pv. phaseoli]KHF47161.1 hypothetical protein QQ30_17795 [Xanthomonas phaseoli pv. phaseoli]KHS06056.1 hypothetical protein RM61_18025 [Xanthomonas phaseoli pv. phaseoli]KHS25475.1 hypothetical protein RM60_17680 [Xanthomonas phaseoli pv. phaseoli]
MRQRILPRSRPAALQASPRAVGLATLARGTVQAGGSSSSSMAARKTPSPATGRKRFTEALAHSPLFATELSERTAATAW